MKKQNDINNINISKRLAHVLDQLNALDIFDKNYCEENQDIAENADYIQKNSYTLH